MTTINVIVINIDEPVNILCSSPEDNQFSVIYRFGFLAFMTVNFDIKYFQYQSMTPRNSTLIKTILFILFAVLISACGIVRTTTVPEPKADDKLVTGIASWYGPNFHGKLTANGEVYDMNDLTGAHKTLPFNTMLLVENIENGKTVLVRINDRGPYVGNRIIDLSRRAAEEIDMIGSGTANVRLYLVEEGDRPITDQNISSRETFTVQLASFESEQEAIRKSNQIPGSIVERVSVAGNNVYRVYYGSFYDINKAREAYEQLKSDGHNGFVKQMEN